MRPFFSGLTVIAGVLGLFSPPLLLLAAVSGVLAMMSAPAGLRPDGKPKTGGLLGGLWDYIVIKDKMTECPYCEELIYNTASKCKHCGEWVDEDEEEDVGEVYDEEYDEEESVDEAEEANRRAG